MFSRIKKENWQSLTKFQSCSGFVKIWNVSLLYSMTGYRMAAETNVLYIYAIVMFQGNRYYACVIFFVKMVHIKIEIIYTKAIIPYVLFRNSSKF